MTRTLNKWTIGTAVLLGAVLALLLSQAPAHAATCTWTGNQDTSATNAANWTCDPPDGGYTVVIPGATNNPILSEDGSSLGITINSVTINEGGHLTITSAGTLHVVQDVSIGGSGGGTLTNDGTLNVGANLHINFEGLLAIGSDGAVDVTSTLTGNTGGTLATAAATFPQHASVTLLPGSTVIYDRSGNQTIAPLTYGNLTLAGSGNKTASANLTVAGDLTRQAPAQFDPATNTVILSGSTSTVSGGFGFYNLTVNKATGQATVSGGDITVSNNLTLTSGRLTTTGSTMVSVTNDSVNAISDNGGWVHGRLQRSIGTMGAGASTPNKTFIFPIGTSTYAPATVVFPLGVTTAGTLEFSTVQGLHLQMGSSGLSSTQRIDRIWTGSAAGGLAYPSYNLSFGFTSADHVGNPTTSALETRRWAGSPGSWSSPATWSSGPGSAAANGFTGAFGDFVVANTGVAQCGGVTYNPANSSHLLYGQTNTTVDTTTGKMVVNITGSTQGRVLFWDGTFRTYTLPGAPGVTHFTDGVYIEGSPFADVICGTSGDDIIYGRQGNDTIFGMGSNTDYNQTTGVGGDRLFGNRGRDTIYNGTSANNLSNRAALMGGGRGPDTIWAGSGADFVRGGRGHDRLHAGSGNNQLLRGGAGNDRVHGGSGANQRLYGSAGDDILNAGSGNGQMLSGNRGNDTLNGGSGTNQGLYGGQGNDLLIAGTGSGQRLVGGMGNDTIQIGQGPNQVAVPGPGGATVTSNGPHTYTTE